MRKKKVSIAAGLALATVSFVALLGAEPTTRPNALLRIKRHQAFDDPARSHHV
jgi:hypothetical protein